MKNISEAYENTLFVYKNLRDSPLNLGCEDAMVNTQNMERDCGGKADDAMEQAGVVDGNLPTGVFTDQKPARRKWGSP